MERRITDGYIEVFIRSNDPFKYLLAIPLQPEFYFMGQCRIASYNLSCIINGDRINIGTDESPSIFCLSDNGVDTVGTYTDIKRPAWVSGFCSRFCLYRVFGLNQIRYVMDIVCSSRNGRTQVVLRNIPVSYAVTAYQQGFVECLHRLRIKEIDTCRPVCVRCNELL